MLRKLFILSTHVLYLSSKTYFQGMWSPMFKTMFFGEFRERTEDRILLPGKLAKDIEEMLQCIYPSQKPVSGGYFTCQFC